MAADKHPQENGPRSPRLAGDDAVRLYAEACDEGRRTIADQLAELDSMRGRAAQVLAFVGSATAFLVGAALHPDGTRSGLFYGLAIFATLASLVSLAIFIVLLLGRAGLKGHNDGWSFTLRPGVLVRDWIEADIPPPTVAEFYRQLALRYSEMVESNDEILQKVRRNYIAFLTAVTIQLISWVTVTWAFG